MSTRNTLKGITWNHSRGFTPLMAAAQRFTEFHPDITIQWEKRTLQEFADKPISSLIKEFDLLIIDHPWIGQSAENGYFHPLNSLISEEFIKDLRNNSVGASFESYCHNEQLWALPIDAATPVASYRNDLFTSLKLNLPETFDQVLELARKGLVIVPGIAIDTLMNFYMFCCALGEEPFTKQGEFISESTGIAALDLYQKLITLVDSSCFTMNPIAVYETLSQTDNFVYCPFAYGYSNYARMGYSNNRLHFADLVSINVNNQQIKLCSTIGGTGLAISASCNHLDAASKYAEFVCSKNFQSNLYTHSGGQPSHVRAWEDPLNNQLTNNYFKDTLPALQRAYLRPRYNGYISFQDQAGDIIRDFLMKAHSSKKLSVIQNLNQLLKQVNSKFV